MVGSRENVQMLVLGKMAKALLVLVYGWDTRDSGVAPWAVVGVFGGLGLRLGQGEQSGMAYLEHPQLFRVYRSRRTRL